MQRTVSQWSKKKKTFVCLIILIILFGFNSHKIFIYKVINYSVTYLFTDFYSEQFFSLPFFVANSHSYESAFTYESPNSVHAKSSVFEAFTYVNFIPNDMILFVTFTVVDILLFIAFRKSTEKKKYFYKDKCNDAKVQELLNDMEQSVKKIMRVIIVNSSILPVVKLFDLFMSVSKFKVWK